MLHLMIGLAWEAQQTTKTKWELNCGTPCKWWLNLKISWNEKDIQSCNLCFIFFRRNKQWKKNWQLPLHHGPSFKCSIEITNASALPGPGPSSQCSGEKWKVQVQSPRCIPGMLGWCRHQHQPAAGCCWGELATKFREMLTFLKTWLLGRAVCYYW